MLGLTLTKGDDGQHNTGRPGSNIPPTTVNGVSKVSMSTHNFQVIQNLAREELLQSHSQPILVAPSTPGNSARRAIVEHVEDSNDVENTTTGFTPLCEQRKFESLEVCLNNDSLLNAIEHENGASQAFNLKTKNHQNSLESSFQATLPSNYNDLAVTANAGEAEFNHELVTNNGSSTVPVVQFTIPTGMLNLSTIPSSFERETQPKHIIRGAALKRIGGAKVAPLKKRNHRRSTPLKVFRLFGKL